MTPQIRTRRPGAGRRAAGRAGRGRADRRRGCAGRIRRPGRCSRTAATDELGSVGQVLDELRRQALELVGVDDVGVLRGDQNGQRARHGDRFAAGAPLPLLPRERHYRTSTSSSPSATPTADDCIAPRARRPRRSMRTSAAQVERQGPRRRERRAPSAGARRRTRARAATDPVGERAGIDQLKQPDEGLEVERPRPARTTGRTCAIRSYARHACATQSQTPQTEANPNGD